MRPSVIGYVFFFSSRRRHTRLQGDWSSDVCSSDLERALEGRPMDWTCQAGNKCFYVSAEGMFQFCYHVPSRRRLAEVSRDELAGYRSEERRVGKECRSRWSPDH